MGYALDIGGTDRWILGALAYWLWRAEKLEDIPAGAPELFKLMTRGFWREAAQVWERIGCPYERALALAAGDAEAGLQALGIFEGLGALPAMRYLKRRLKA